MDSLNLPHEYVFGKPDCALNLTDIYPFVTGPVSDMPDIIYLASWNQLRGADVLPENVICIGGGGEARDLFAQRGLSGLIYPDEADQFAVLRDVQVVFSKYYKLERELLDVLLADAPIRSVLNVCAKFTESQIVLYGQDWRLLDYCDNFMPDDDDAVWKETLAAKRSVMPMLPRDKVRMLPSNPKDFPRSTFIDARGGRPRHIVVSFDYGDSRIATMIFRDVGKPITQNHLWLVDYLADILHPLIMERYNTVLNMRNYFRTSISTALRYANTDTTFLLSILARYGWNTNDDFQFLVVRLPQGISAVSHYLYNYENVFADAYSDTIALRHTENIVLLLHNGGCSILEKCLPILEKQLALDNGICSIGQIFCDFSQFKLQYELALLPFQRTQPGNSRILSFSAILGTYLIGEMSSFIPLHAICHHAAVRIHEYDLVNGTDFLLALKTYLMNNRSLKLASDSLFIHRSTLTYRLNCIGEIAPMNLDDPNERLHILLSCIALSVLDGDAEKRQLGQLSKSREQRDRSSPSGRA